jgi:hypothetical protein
MTKKQIAHRLERLAAMTDEQRAVELEMEASREKALARLNAHASDSIVFRLTASERKKR